MTESEHAVILADKVLDRPSGDPDDDLAVLARQLLRARERLEWRRIDTAPRYPLDDLRYGPTLLLFVDDNVGVGCWDQDFDKFYVEYPEGGSQPSHWMPLPEPPNSPSSTVESQ